METPGEGTIQVGEDLPRPFDPELEVSHLALSLLLARGGSGTPKRAPLALEHVTRRETYTRVTPPMQSDAAERVVSQIFPRQRLQTVTMVTPVRSDTKARSRSSRSAMNAELSRRSDSS